MARSTSATEEWTWDLPSISFWSQGRTARHPCLTRDLNPGTSVQQPASLTTSPPLGHFLKEIYFLINVNRELYWIFLVDFVYLLNIFKMHSFVVFCWTPFFIYLFIYLFIYFWEDLYFGIFILHWWLALFLSIKIKPQKVFCLFSVICVF